MSWKAEYIFLIVASTLADYYAGIQMGKRPKKSQRLPFLVLSLVVNLGLLFAFKYFNFLEEYFYDAMHPKKEAIYMIFANEYSPRDIVLTKV